MVRNPNTEIRTALAGALTLATGTSFYEESVPIDVDPVPMTYGILERQGKTPFAESKSHHEWQSEIDIRVVSRGEKGFFSSKLNDEIEDKIYSVLPGLGLAGGFTVKRYRIVRANTERLEVFAQTIVETYLRLEMWVSAGQEATT